MDILGTLGTLGNLGQPKTATGNLDLQNIGCACFFVVVRFLPTSSVSIRRNMDHCQIRVESEIVCVTSLFIK